MKASVLGAIAAVALALAANAPAQHARERVLTADAAAELDKTLSSITACRIDHVSVGQQHATARLCLRAAPGACYVLRLDDPQPACDGEVVGPWCVRWEEGEPTLQLRDAVRQALGGAPRVWRQPDPMGGGQKLRSVESAGDGRQPLLGPLALGFALSGVPLLAGVWLGRGLRQRKRWWFAGIAVAATLGTTRLAIDRILQVGAWDVICVGLLLAIGIVLGTCRIDRANALLLVVSAALALIGLELGVRRWLPPLPPFAPPATALFMVPPGGWDAGCTVLYDLPDSRVEFRFKPATSRANQQHLPLVVHLGDSMTFGQGVEAGQAFPALLDIRRKDVVHANYGVPAVGTDFEYQLLQSILAAQPVAMVVLHVYVGNDVYDIDRPYECCEYGPLLDYAAGRPTPRCPLPAWRFTLASRLARSPAPYALRVATTWSLAARHATVTLSQLTFRLDVPPHFLRSEGEADEAGWAHFAQILEAMQSDLRSRGVDFVVNLLPSAWALQTTDTDDAPSYQAARRIAAISQKLGIHTLDAWDVFAGAVQRDGLQRYFLSQDGRPDIHFTPAGHRLLAEWLAGQLPPVQPPQ